MNSPLFDYFSEQLFINYPSIKTLKDLKFTHIGTEWSDLKYIISFCCPEGNCVDDMEPLLQRIEDFGRLFQITISSQIYTNECSNIYE